MMPLYFGRADVTMSVAFFDMQHDKAVPVRLWKRPGFHFPKCREVGMQRVWLCLPTCPDVAPSCHATRPRCVGTWRGVTCTRFFTWKSPRQRLLSPRESAAF